MYRLYTYIHIIYTYIMMANKTETHGGALSTMQMATAKEAKKHLWEFGII